MSDVTTDYSAKATAVIVNGLELDGKGETFASFSQNEDDYTLTVGADGESVFSETNNRSGQLDVTLLQSSASNDTLSELRNTKAVFPVIVRDTKGRTLLSCEKGRIMKPADIEFARDAGERTWSIISGSWYQEQGGNTII